MQEACCAAQQGTYEGFILRAIERAVQVVAGVIERFVVARSAESHGLVKESASTMGLMLRKSTTGSRR